jgi:hypothetical protein
MYKFFVVMLMCFSPQQTQSEPWSSLLVNDKQVSFHFNRQNISVINDWFMKATGITIISDPNFNYPVTLFTPKKISLSDSFKFYNKTLELYGYTLNKENKFLVIKKIEKIETNSNKINVDQNKNQQEIKIIQLKNNNASNVSRIINELFAVPNIDVNSLINWNLQNDTLRSSGQNGLGKN